MPDPELDRAANHLRDVREAAAHGEPAPAPPREAAPVRDVDDELVAGPWRVPRDDDGIAAPYRSEREAHGELLEQAAYQREREQEQAERQRQEERQQARRQVREAGEWHDADRAQLQQLQEHVQAHHQRRAVLQDAVRQVEQLRAQNPAAARQAEAKIREAGQQLQAEEQQLQQAAQQVQQAQGKLAVRRNFAELTATVPDLANAQRREDLVQYAIRQGIPESRARSETDPTVVAQYYRQMQQEEREAERSRRKEQRAEWSSRNYRGPRQGNDVPSSSAEAKQRLLQSGHLGDAVGLLALEKMERSR